MAKQEKLIILTKTFEDSDPIAIDSMVNEFIPRRQKYDMYKFRIIELKCIYYNNKYIRMLVYEISTEHAEDE